MRCRSSPVSRSPRSQNRHLAVIADGRRALRAQAYEGGDWTALEFLDRRLIGLLDNFVRHDIYVQKIWAELGPDLEATFGEGLAGLTNLDGDLTARSRPSRAAAAGDSEERPAG